jgi:hypothetical protein
MLNHDHNEFNMKRSIAFLYKAIRNTKELGAEGKSPD